MDEVPIPTEPAVPKEFMVMTGEEDVAVAVEVEMYREFPALRNVHARSPLLPSTSASCGPVDEATVSAQSGVVVPIPKSPPGMMRIASAPLLENPITPTAGLKRPVFVLRAHE